jgi:hypothetical protein
MNATAITTATLSLAAEPAKPAKKKSKSAEFIATFIKADGSPRTMRFACTPERLAHAFPGMD